MVPRRILPVIIVSQFAGTSLWFASNAVLQDLQTLWHLPQSSLGLMTSAVQLGFILGTLLFAVLAIADRFSPRLIFLLCSLAGALANLGIYFFAEGLGSLLAFRFITGIFLAGIYPVGMKIAAAWYRRGLGKALGLLVGALVVGTAFPHLLRSLGATVSYEQVILPISALSAAGGLLMYVLVPDGPHLPAAIPFNRKALVLIFRSRQLRAAAFGYFGHMWELYTFWAFVPLLASAYFSEHQGAAQVNISFWAFTVIAAGGVGCAAGGYLSLRQGSDRVAFAQLIASGGFCLASPLLLNLQPPLFLAALVIWGVVVVGDSPQFSALIAKTAPREWVGSALTIVNSIGFAVTIPSIELANFLLPHFSAHYLFLPLTIGPLIGALSLWRYMRHREQ